jgi:hypothetical protein
MQAGRPDHGVEAGIGEARQLAETCVQAREYLPIWMVISVVSKVS